MKKLILPLIVMLTTLTSGMGGVPSDYKGKPSDDAEYKGGAQVIPGKLECAFYDLGGEGVAYHDFDPINHGGNELNLKPDHHRPQSREYFWAFRKDDGMDSSYTKDFVDFTPENLFTPKVNQLYIGWTENDEWVNYTVNVKKAGKYKIIAVYSNEANTIKFSINGKPAAECKLPKATDSYHHWNRAEIGEITFAEAGLQLLTFHYNSGNNFAYFEFEPVEKSADETPKPAAK